VNEKRTIPSARRAFLKQVAVAAAATSAGALAGVVEANTGLKLTFACGLYDRTLPLYRGDVRPDGINLNFDAIDSPRDIFDRMGGGLEFDIAEFSSSEFITRFSTDKSPLVALPVFPSRTFRHGFVCINRKSGIKSPKDLEGRRVGVELYTQTASVYIRGLLQHEYGVDLARIHWIQGAIETPGAWGHPRALPLLGSVSMENNASDRSLNQLLEAGAIDALIGASLPSALGRNANVARLFPNFREIEKEYYKRTRIFPIMHLVAMRRDVYERNPWIATSMFEALSRSKELALKRMRSLGALSYMLPWLASYLAENDEVFGVDPWPYGVEINRPTLEALMTYLTEQSMIPKQIPIDDLFVPVYG
jgi:4,5-dihydroxyphthalate decarboxylase